MAKSTEKGSKARGASVKQDKPQPEPRRGAMKGVMKEVKAAPMKEMKAAPMKQAPRGAMKEAGLKQSKDAKAASSSRRDSAAAAYVSRQISQLSRGYAVVSGR